MNNAIPMSIYCIKKHIFITVSDVCECTQRIAFIAYFCKL